MEATLFEQISAQAAPRASGAHRRDAARAPRRRRATARTTVNKDYRPAEIEAAHYARWEAAGYFAPSGHGEPYCIVIPPPNVTGTLHMGHALQDTIMDALTRYHRMRGRNDALATRHRSRRHRDADGRRAAARARRHVAHGARPRALPRARLAVEGALRQHDLAAAAPARRVGRLVARPLHDGRRAVARRAPKCSCGSTTRA